MEPQRTSSSSDLISQFVETRRPDIWDVPPWECAALEGSGNDVDTSDWPPLRLAEELIEAYFNDAQLILPLLNRVLFQADYHAERWKEDVAFARVCLGVFALGSKLVDDARVRWMDGADSKSSGWIYIQQMLKLRYSLLARPSLEDLQSHVVGGGVFCCVLPLANTYSCSPLSSSAPPLFPSCRESLPPDSKPA